MVRFPVRKMVRFPLGMVMVSSCTFLLATTQYVRSFSLLGPNNHQQSSRQQPHHVLFNDQQSATVSSIRPTFFVGVDTPVTRKVRRTRTALAFSSQQQNIDVLPDVQLMRISELKHELESYGISTKSFLEKKELVEALTKARADGLKPKTQGSQTSSSSSQASTSSSTSSSSPSSNTATDSRSRKERLDEEITNCQKMKASELRKELQELGIDCKSFFEKSEFVHALAGARVDGIRKKSSTGASSAGGEGYAEYSNVEVITDDKAGPRPKQSQQQQQQQKQQQSSNPFGDMGGMGGIADMLKNFGGAGGAPGGANPFGNPFGGGASPFGGGANPFGGGMGGMGDMMGKAQQMMSNPKVREIITKAQSNPRIMAKVNECMSNPASFAKYQNDPEVSELITELRKYI